MKRRLDLGVDAERIFVDHGLTGINRDRPLCEALAACWSGNTLVVTKLDRLARSLPDARAIAEEVTARQVRLSLGGSICDPIDAAGRLLFNYEHCSSYAVRWARLDDYDRFVERWPSLQDWFDAPLRRRLLDKDNCVRGEHPHGGASVIMPYLTYLSLVHGVGPDSRCCSQGRSPARSNTRCETAASASARICSTSTSPRLEQLGYARARTQLLWPLGLMLLHRGNPDLTALGMHDLAELREAIDAFTARLRLEPLREFYSREPDGRPAADVANTYLRSAIARLHGARAAVQHGPSQRTSDRPGQRRNLGRSPRAGLRAAEDPRSARALPAPAPAGQSRPASDGASRPRSAAPAGDLDGGSAPRDDQSGRSASRARRGVSSLARHADQPAHRRSVEREFQANGGHADHPVRDRDRRLELGRRPSASAFTRADIPKITRPLPRFIPDHELAALMTAVDQLANPYQRAALRGSLERRPPR